MKKMTPRVSKLLEKALTFSSSERGILIDRLIATLDNDPAEEGVERAWKKEIERRMEDIRSVRVKMIPAEQVLRRARSRLRRKGAVGIGRWFAKLDRLNSEPLARAEPSQSAHKGSSSRRRG